VRPRSAIEVGRPDAATIQIARESCAAVADRPVALAESFYWHLFDMVPEVRAMFPADMSMQHERMSRTLVDAVKGADDPAAVERLLQRMGGAHARNHAVIPEHYPHVGRALVRAVRELSPRWSPVVASAWVQVYEWMAAHMILGAENSTAHTAQHRPPPAYHHPPAHQPAHQPASGPGHQPALPTAQAPAQPRIEYADGFRGSYGGAYGEGLPPDSLRERALSPWH
jgi:hemoglobin-like flavoprotein